MPYSFTTRQTGRLPRLTSLVAALAGVAAFAAAAPSHAQSDYPSKPIRLIVPYAAGGFADTRARLIGEQLGKALGQTVVVENKAGAGGVIGTDAIAKAAPDGYVIGMGNLAPLSVNPSLMKNLPYQPLKDLAPVVLIETGPLILSVANSVPAKSVQELIALAKKQPGKLAFGSSGVGGAHHLSGEMFKMQAKIDIVHVPYKGGNLAATDLLAGHIPMMFEMGYAALPSIKANKIRPLAVTSTKRLAVLPDVPTLAESGLTGFESYNWQGIVAPAGTPPAILKRLNTEINKLLDAGPLKTAILDSGSQVGGGTPETFGAFIASESTKWSTLVKDADIRME